MGDRAPGPPAHGPRGEWGASGSLGAVVILLSGAGALAEARGGLACGREVGPVGCGPPWCRAASEGPDVTGVLADLQDGAASKGRWEGL